MERGAFDAPQGFLCQWNVAPLTLRKAFFARGEVGAFLVRDLGPQTAVRRRGLLVRPSVLPWWVDGAALRPIRKMGLGATRSSVPRTTRRSTDPTKFNP